MSSEDNYIEMTGQILDVCRDKFRVLIDDTEDMIVLCTCSGKCGRAELGSL